MFLRFFFFAVAEFNMAAENVEDDQAQRAFFIKGQTFEVGPRYYDLAYIGEGAYGMVVYVLNKFRVISDCM